MDFPHMTTQADFTRVLAAARTAGADMAAAVGDLEIVAEAMGGAAPAALAMAAVAVGTAATFIETRPGHGLDGLRVWSVPGSGWAATATFSRMAMAARLSEVPDIEGFPDQALMRLDAAHARPAVAHVLMRSAADHALAGAADALLSRPGCITTPDGFAWAAGGRDAEGAAAAVRWLSDGMPGRLATGCDLFVGADQ